MSMFQLINPMLSFPSESNTLVIQTVRLKQPREIVVRMHFPASTLFCKYQIIDKTVHLVLWMSN